MKARRPKRLKALKPYTFTLADITTDAYGEHFGTDVKIEQKVVVEDNEICIDMMNKEKARNMRRIGKWLLKAADWIETQPDTEECEVEDGGDDLDVGEDSWEMQMKEYP